MNEVQTEQEQVIAAQNQKGLLRLCQVFMGVGVITVLIALISKNKGGQLRGTVLMVVSIGLWVLTKLLMKKHPSPRFVLRLFYAVVALMLLAGCWTGSFGSPEMPAFTFPLYLMILPTFLVDRPSRQMAFSGTMTLVFWVFSFLAKSRTLFIMDVRHTLVVLFICAMSTNMLIRDRRETMDKEQELKDTTFRDALTGLLNKRGVERVCSMLENGVEGSLILLDLDHFKEVNDGFGHAVGDLVLNHVAFAMRRSFRSSDLLLRTGGDEFAIYAVGLIDPDGLRDKLAQIRSAVADDARGCPHVTCSLGAAVWRRGEMSNVREAYAELFRRADAALYQAKESGRNCWVIAD